MIKTRKIKWGAFSDKHKKYIKNALKYRHNVAEGAVRSGKTIDHCIIFAMYLEKCPDKFHLASGSSLPNAKLNIGECNGYGLEHLFRGRCKWGKYRDNDALFIQTQTGEKIVIFAGGGKADSYKKILGNSYGGWIATEVNEHYDSDDSRTSFIKVAMARQLASKQKFTLWDLNPSDPHAKIYTDYVDNYLQFDWYNYQHFTIFDNATMSEEAIEEIKQKYNEGTVWYRRDILGERAIAEGLVFPYFADNEEFYLIDEDKIKKIRFNHITIGVDFGDSGSKYSFHCTGFYNDWSDLIVLTERDIEKSNGIDTTRLCNEFVMFYREVIHDWGYPQFVFCDSASNTLINTLRSACMREGLNGNVIMPVTKNEIADRPRTIDLLFRLGRLKINKKCGNLRKALRSLVWDDKHPDIPKDENVDNINDYYDSFCYTFITHTDYIER